MPVNRVSQLQFPVELEKAYLVNGDAIPHRRVVVRQDTRRVLGLVSDHYKIVPHAQVISVFDQMDNIKQGVVSLCKEGAVMIAYYHFKDNDAITHEVKVGDVVRFFIRVFNSYNQQYGIGFELIGIRLSCSNGLLVPNAMSRLSFRHFDTFDVRRFAGLIDAQLHHATSVVQIWKEWAIHKPSEDCIRKFMAKLRLGRKDKERLFPLCVEESEKDGVWGVFNVFSRYISHEMKIERPENRLLMQRSKQMEILNKFYYWKWNGS